MRQKTAETTQKVFEGGGIYALLEGSNARKMGKSEEKELHDFTRELIRSKDETIALQKQALETTMQVMEMLMQRMDGASAHKVISLKRRV